MDSDEALMAVKDGHKVLVASAAAQPQVLLEALRRRLRALQGISLFHMLPMLPEVPYLADDVAGKVCFQTCYPGSAVRACVNEGTGEFVPAFLSEYTDMTSRFGPDVALLQVSPPDKHGFCSLGVTVLQLKRAIEHASVVIAQINHKMPRTHGESFVHVSEITHFVEAEMEVAELPRPVIGETEKAIGSYIAGLIRDKDCLQLGIGAIPDAVLGFLTDKRGLGIYSEMFSDGVMELYEAGVIDNKHKNIHKGKMIATFVMGTRKFYDFIDDNPSILMLPSDVCNDPCNIGQNDRLISINSSVSVDLMGQAASDCIGTRQYSGVGGQVDFIRGAQRSKDGVSILAFPATAGKEGALSRIVAQHAAGTPITTTRNEIDYVVTEYGVARLKYKTLRERANELIAISHPDFRAELRDALKKFNW
ncbi:MAG: 4-hydroxybutyrate CoA-transferase [Clostridiales Family XIII bacterium]|jgi:4-hydroxybutyrate CoA-transferase|nr:4-hydroxybutyrate CoA-transferase [Clostridiales Family XIII bacterium]